MHFSWMKNIFRSLPPIFSWVKNIFRNLVPFFGSPDQGKWGPMGLWAHHKIVFPGGLPPPRPPALLGGFQPPRPPGGGPAAPRAPLHTERLRLSDSGSTWILVPRSWYQDPGTKILLPTIFREKVKPITTPPDKVFERPGL